jgi:hypothetical protein
VRVEKEEDVPAAEAVEARVRQHGAMRLLVAPGLYDGLRGRLEAMGFRGEYDPLMRAVVCVREKPR